MLNCTDLECILHHHHYYAHLHQLQPHLPPEHDHDAVSTAAEEVRDGIQTRDNDTDPSQSSHLDPPIDSVYMICGVLIAMILVGVIIVLLAVTIRNSASRAVREHKRTIANSLLLDRELRAVLFSQAEGIPPRRTIPPHDQAKPPWNQKLRPPWREQPVSTLAISPPLPSRTVENSRANRGFNSNGLTIPSNIPKKLTRLYVKYKMVGSNGTMIAIRLVRSKLRKREDHSNTVHPEPAVVQTAAPPAPALLPVPGVAPSCVQDPEGCCPADLGAAVEPDLAYSTTTTTSAGQFVWQFPPPYPPPNTPPPQYTLYNNDQDNLVHTLQSDRPGFAKGFRKNLGGRWRRLVKRKPEMETCAIPPELKDQLKTIYVY